MKPLTSEQRAKLWLRELGQGTPEDGEILATRYPLAPALIHHASAAAKAHAIGGDLQPADIQAGVRAVQSTPLVADFGRLLGMLSTHWTTPRELTERMEDVLDHIARRTAFWLDGGRL